MKATLALLVLCLFSLATLRAEDPAPEPKSPSKEQLETIASSLKWQTGTITLKDGLAKINLTDNYRFIDSADSQKVLHDIWGNPPNADMLGMIFPKDKGPLNKDAWAVVIRYEDSGYVKDDDAAKLDYTALMKQMQQDTAAANPEREKAGYPGITLVGWAEPPHYDPASHKLYWAKELKFAGDEGSDSLNYDIRILGRRGVLVLRVIGGMDELQEIKDKTPDLLGMVDFQPGNTYAEFDPKIDKVAEYGLAGLIAGGVLAGAAKLGFFGALFKWGLAAVLALKKAIILVIVAIGAAIKKIAGKFKGNS